MEKRQMNRLLCFTVLGLMSSIAMATPQSSQSSAGSWRASDVAGDYYFGDGLGINCSMHLSHDQKFTFRWTGCLGEYGRNNGPYHFKGDELVLEPSLSNEKSFGGTPTHFYPVAWGRRLYLVPSADMPKFCRKVAVGWNGYGFFGIHGDYYVRLDRKFPGSLAPISGLPQVPKNFEHILKASIVVHVTNADKDAIVIDKGQADGIEKGAVLYNREFANEWLIVTKVSEHSAEARLFENYLPLPKVGEEFKAFDARVAASQTLASGK